MRNTPLPFLCLLAHLATAAAFSDIRFRLNVRAAKRGTVLLHEATSRYSEDSSSSTANGINGIDHTNDTILRYENDVAKVLRELRPWKYDPTVPKWFRARRLSFTNYWDLTDWEKHTSRRRYLRYVFALPKSRLVRRIVPQLSVLAIWSGVVCFLGTTKKNVFAKLEIPLTALSLVSTFIGALQALRTNQALGRLRDGRLAMGKMVHCTRDTATLLSTYLGNKDKKLCLKSARLLALFGWALKQHLRETLTTKDVYEALLLPHHRADAKFIMNERKIPVAIIRRLRQIVASSFHRGQISNNEHRLLEQNLQSLDQAVATCDRVRSTPIPPVYGSHASRLMIFYLAFLPMALLNFLSVRGTMEVTMAVGYAMLGLDEISHLFEQPFKFMPLYQISKVSMMDVADAFCRPPPPLELDDISEDQDMPAYWVKEGDDWPVLPYDGRSVGLLV
mmetsp:Transcript_18539/g.40141  ORF Transcript_18539/g.40141 Transcript_18539/m.40141 type:complete len:448 (+) Transcript_18539:29-1372(+)